MRPPSRGPLRIVAIFVTLGLLWTWTSSAVLVGSGVYGDPAFWIESLKGTAATLVSGALVYWLAERELRRVQRSTNLLKAVLEGVDDPLFVKNREGRYQMLNAAAAAVLGRPIEEILGRDDQALLEPGLAQRRREQEHAIIQAGISSSVEEVITRPTGEPRIYLVTRSPYRDDTGQVVGTISVARDITARKQSESELREAHQSSTRDLAELRAVLQHTPVGIALLTPDGLMVYWNPALERVHGVELPKPPLQPAQLAEIFRVCTSAGQPVSLEDWPLTRISRGETLAPEELVVQPAGSDEPRSICYSGGAVHGEDGELSLRVLTAVDVTAQRRIEEELRTSERRLRDLASSIPQLVWTACADGSLDSINRRARDYTGLSAERLLGWGWLEVVHPEDAPQARSRWADTVASGQPVDYALRLRNHAGDYRWHISRQVPARDATGAVLRWYGIWSDVHDLQVARDALREERDRLARFADSAPGVMYTYRLRPDGSIALPYANSIMERMFGLPLEEVREDATGIFRLMRPDDVGRIQQSILESAQTMTRWRQEFRYEHPQRGELWLEGQAVPLREPDGSILWHGFILEATERKRSEQALVDREARYRAVVESSPDGFMMVTPEGRLLEVNDTYVTQSGYSRDELLTMGVPDLDVAIPPVEIQRRTHELIESVSSRFESVHRRKDGSHWPVEVTVTSWAIAGGVILAFVRDISQRKQAEAALRESEELYRRLIQVLPSAVFVHAEGRILFSNPACLEFLQFEPGTDLTGRTLFEVFHPDYHPQVERRLAAFKETGQPLPAGEETMVRRDGRPVPAYVVASPIVYQGKRCVLAVLNDLTERERSMSLLRTVLGSVSDAILTVDIEGKILSANPATQRMFGITVEELIGQNVRVLMPEPHASQHDEYIQQYLRSGEKRVIGAGRELEAARSDGTRFPIELTVTEFLLDGRQHFTGVIRDISARRRLEEQYRQAQKMEAIGQLAGGVAHDFNNLLTVINGYSELLLAATPGDDLQRGPIAAILDAGERASSLTAQLLAFSRKTIIEPRILDLNEVIEHLGKMLRRLIGEDIQLVTVLDPALGKVRVDPGQFEQVLLNLAVNARDAMPRGGRFTIQTRAVELAHDGALPAPDLVPGRYAQIEVSDTGEGIAPDVLGKIFEPFFTTKGVGKGTGLGLATVYGILKQANGHIAVESEVGQGTTFILHLPCTPEDEKVPALLGSDRIAPRGTETLLVVEDEDVVLRLVAATLTGQGYQVLTATRGSEALEVAQTHPGPIALVLTDVVMPDLGGRDLAEALRQQRPNLRVLYMSGYTDDAVVRHGLEAASVAFLQKPFTPLALARKVRAVLDGG
ncbi:MAG: PAS domain S-box protein [Gemmataceae bacterium]